MLTVYGASDDTIVVEGDISEEFPYARRGHGQASGELLAFSDGTILRIEWAPAGAAVWRIEPVVYGAADLEITQAPENDESNRSDRAALSGAVWVVQGMAYAIAITKEF